MRAIAFTRRGSGDRCIVKILVQRCTPTGRSTSGKMFLDDVLFCDTLEPDPNTPVHVGHPSIPPGVYPVQLTMSPHMGYITPELIGVPGRTAIRIHIANKPEDLLGCTAVGTQASTDWVSNSKTTFEALMAKLTTLSVTQITAEYVDAV
jgi:Family of unknown function (DUF5675)